MVTATYNYSVAELGLAAKQAPSITQMLGLLGLKNSGGRRASIRRALDRYGIDTSHFRRVAWTKYSTELLTEAASASQSVNEVLDYLGIPRRGGAHTHISRRLKNARIDTSHFSYDTGVQSRPCEQFGHDRLAEAAKDSESMRQILGRLGVPESGRVRDDVRRQLRAHAIAEPARYRRLELNESALRRISASSYSVAEIIRKLGLPVNETNRRRILRSLGRHDIDTSHFRRQLTSAVIKQRALDPQAIMVERPMGSNRIPGSILRRAVIQCGVSPSCSCCGIKAVWQGKALTLEVDHINGNYLDNRKENLRLLCPNCHSQTETFAGRNRARLREPANI